MNDYSRHYTVLGITHDTDWEALRARYKRLIGQWHPDRFPADAPERELAEEHTKQIIIAYQALDRYYRGHGVLPPVEPATSAEKTGITTRSPASVPGSARHAPGAATEATPYQAAGRATERLRWELVVLSAVVVGTYATYRFSGHEAREPDATTADARNAEVAPTEPRASQSRGISAGSTLGEVYAIQGIPTLTQGDTWHYGKSSIRFAQGRVVSWTQHPDNPLRIARDQPVDLREGVFDVGSTKDEVRSIQGTPVTETDTVWDYGPSRIYFEHNRVVRWEASPLQPLHVPH